jgi:hypothetical protein
MLNILPKNNQKEASKFNLSKPGFHSFFQSPPSLLSQCSLVFESLTSQLIAEDEPHLVNVEALGEEAEYFFQWLFSYLYCIRLIPASE